MVSGYLNKIWKLSVLCGVAKEENFLNLRLNMGLKEGIANWAFKIINLIKLLRLIW